MVSTKHCCWGTCRSDARYPDKLHKSLKELEAAGKKAFIPFPKPSQGVDKCQRWINACSREGFTKENVNRNTYICAGSRTKTPRTKTPRHKPPDKNPLDKNPPGQKTPGQKPPRQNILFRNFITFVFRMSYGKEISIWFLAVKYVRYGSIK